MKKPTVLFVGKCDRLPGNFKSLMEAYQFEVIELCDKTAVLRYLEAQKADVIVVDSSQTGECCGLELAQQNGRWDKRTPVIIITQKSSADLTIAALTIGINDYFKQPLSIEELARSIKQSINKPLVPAPLLNPLTSASLSLETPHMIGGSYSISQIKGFIHKVAPIDSNVLITGETGTGKELVAALIHRNSPRRQKAYARINCAALPDGLFESELFGHERGAFTGAHSSYEGKLKIADGGTVLLDEIGELSPFAQAKILRAIETKEVEHLGGRKSFPLNIRIIAATNQDLEQGMVSGKFRRDLYFRLNVARIHLPPLRERRADISVLLDHFIQEMNDRFGKEVEGFTDEALEALLRYDYPGNIRELKNIIEAAFVNVTSRRISFMDLPEHFRAGLQNKEAKTEFDSMLVALSATNWNRSEAARKLHWSRRTFYRKMAKYDLKTDKRQRNGKMCHTQSPFHPNYAPNRRLTTEQEETVEREAGVA